MSDIKPLNISSRLIAIDAFRALIMVLMIFVNDLWTLIDIPNWLGHVAADVDGMGLADFVFPAFLFIVGLSVPFAIEARKKKGDSKLRIAYHIIIRTIALLAMGIFLLNADTLPEQAILSKPVWTILSVIAFFLIWLNYPKPEGKYVTVLKTIGIVLLIGLALVFRKEGTVITAMEIQWWGILGLIGWAYFTASFAFLFTGGNHKAQYVVLLGLLLINCSAFLGWLTPIEPLKNQVWFVADGAMAAFSMAGIITALAYKQMGVNDKKFWLLIVATAIIFIAFGLLTRPIWGISKIKATPSWVTICSGLSMLFFLAIVYITDVLHLRKWYNYIKPAGTSTLTAYLIPYVHYAIFGMIGSQLPAVLRTGNIGLLKSFIYALIIVAITGYLERKKLHLKI